MSSAITPSEINGGSLLSKVGSYKCTIIFGMLAVAAIAGTVALAVLAPYAAIMAVISMPLFPIIAAGVGTSALSCIALIFVHKIEAQGYAEATREYPVRQRLSTNNVSSKTPTGISPSPSPVVTSPASLLPAAPLGEKGDEGRIGRPGRYLRSAVLNLPPSSI
jgi:hypothetical protein